MLLYFIWWSLPSQVILKIFNTVVFKWLNGAIALRTLADVWTHLEFLMLLVAFLLQLFYSWLSLLSAKTCWIISEQFYLNYICAAGLFDKTVAVRILMSLREHLNLLLYWKAIVFLYMHCWNHCSECVFCTAGRKLQHIFWYLNGILCIYGGVGGVESWITCFISVSVWRGDLKPDCV